MKTKRTTPFITFCVPTFRILIVVSMLSLSLTALAQRTGETAIRQLLHNQTIAWNNGDMEEFMKGYWNSDSLIFIGKSGLKYGYNTALKNYKKNYGSRIAMGSLQFDLVQVKRLSPHYYFAVGK